jgi:hypothetical protein
MNTVWNETVDLELMQLAVAEVKERVYSEIGAIGEAMPGVDVGAVCFLELALDLYAAGWSLEGLVSAIEGYIAGRHAPQVEIRYVSAE